MNLWRSLLFTLYLALLPQLRTLLNFSPCQTIERALASYHALVCPFVEVGLVASILETVTSGSESA